MIDIIRDKQTLANIGKDWNNLVRFHNSPLLCHEWFMAGIEAFHEHDDLCIAIVRSKDCFNAIAPLVVVNKKGIKRAELIGSSFLFEPLTLLHRDKQSLTELLRVITNLKIPVYLRKIPALKNFSENSLSVPIFKGIMGNDHHVARRRDRIRMLGHQRYFKG